MTVGPNLLGAWRRSGLLIDGTRRVDHCDVLWLQTPDLYADIRTLIEPSAPRPTEGVTGLFAAEMAFAGQATWADPLMTWVHELDSSLEPSTDANPLVTEDGVLVERGHVVDRGREVPFVEEWLRMTGDAPSWAADVDDRRIRVEVGRWAIEVTDGRPGGVFRATRYVRQADRWAATGSVTA